MDSRSLDAVRRAGEAGYFWIRYGSCGFDNYMWDITQIGKIYRHEPRRPAVRH